MNGLAHHDHRRPAAQAVRLLDRRRRLRRRGRAVRREPRPDRRDDAARRRRRARRAARAARASRRRSRPCSSRSSAPRSSRRRSISPTRRRDRRVAAAGRARRRPSRGRASSDVGPLLIAAVGITLVSLTDTIATVDELRRPARRRGRAQPGDGRHRRGERRRRALPGLRRVDQRLAHRRRRAVGRQEPAHRRSSAPGLVAVLLLFLNSLLADLPQSALAAVVIAAALSLMDLRALRRYWRVRPVAVVLSLVATLGVMLLRRARRASSSPIVLSILLFFRRNWWPHGAVLGTVDGVDGWHSVERPPERRSRSRASSCTAGRRRCSSPTPASSAGRSATSCASASRGGSCCSARRSPTSTSPPPRCSSDLDHELNAAGVHMAFAEMRSRLQDLTLRYGLLETLDRDHFYPTLDSALAAIQKLKVSDHAEAGPVAPRPGQS